MANWLLEPQVKRVVAAEQISPEELDEMLRRAAITTHPRGNRRFHHWVFQVSGNQLQWMSHDDTVEQVVEGELALTVYDECPDCEGQGCKACGYAGEIKLQYINP